MSTTKLHLVTGQESGNWPESRIAHLDAQSRQVLQQVVEYVRQATPDAWVVANETSEILLDLALDHECVAAAWLVPQLRAHPESARPLRERFGARMIDLAEGVLRMSEIGALSGKALAPDRPEAQAMQLEALRKMLLAMVQDVRVVLIKLADHLRELRAVVKSGDTARQMELAGLTRDIFAPLANRLGVWQIKWELEDLSLRLLEPDSYKRIARLLDEKRHDREHYIENVVAQLKGELTRAGIATEVTEIGRAHV